MAMPLCPAPPGAPNAVDVIFGVVGHVEIDHVRNVFDIQATRRHIGRHQQLDGMLAETVEDRIRAGTGSNRRAAPRRG